jgi:hypothetical protein
VLDARALPVDERRIRVKSMLATAATVLALAGWSGAQTVEFRIVERGATNQGAPPITGTGTDLSPANSAGNYAVQARVTAGPNGLALGGFQFDIVIPGEPDANGTLARLKISSFGAYYTGAAQPNSAIGSGGLAASFTYLAGINPNFNGLVNTSSGTFTNQPGQQEIGLVSASASGSALLGTPDIDPSGENNIGTWSGYGVGAAPNNGTTAPLDPTIGATYFAEGQFIDVYRFRYTVSDFSSRAFSITLANAAAQVFNQFLFNGGSWGPQATTVDAGSVSVTPLTVQVIVAGACCSPTGDCVVIGQAGCIYPGTWTAGGACAPNPCPLPGACCQGTVCQVIPVANCTGANTRFAGAGSACNTLGNVQMPCCFADFNQSGQVTVADIMDFINAWLAGSPWTDVNGFGGVNVADIFDFLTAWFAGCN